MNAAALTTTSVGRPNVAERKAAGRAARRAAQRSSHARWEPVADRPDPVGLLAEQNISREPDLVPIRHGRMLVSPFTFFRGAARIMASDLAASPRAGLVVQLCGDAHCPTSERSPRPSAPCCSTSTTSTRRCRGPSSTTSSGWRRASSSPRGTTVSTPPPNARPHSRRFGPTAREWRSLRS